MIDFPSIWRDKHDAHYEVYDLTNEGETNVSVSYRDESGKRRSALLADFIKDKQSTDRKRMPNEYVRAAEEHYKLLRPVAHFTRDRKFIPERVGLYYYLAGEYPDDASYQQACKLVEDAIHAVDSGAGMHTRPLLADKLNVPFLDMLEVDELHNRGINPVIKRQGGACVWGNSVSNRFPMPFVRLWVSLLDYLFTLRLRKDKAEVPDLFEDKVADYITAAVGREPAMLGGWHVCDGMVIFESNRVEGRYYVKLDSEPELGLSVNFVQAVLALYPESLTAKLLEKHHGIRTR